MKTQGKCKPSVACAGFSALLGISLIVAGIVVLVCFRDLVDNVIKSRIPLTEESEITEKWISPPIKPMLRLYFFNCTNPLEFLGGAKPKLVEMGPYVYEQRWEKVNVSFSSNGEEVQYQQKKTYYFREDLSVGQESDIVTIPNIPMLASVNQMMYAGRLVRMALGSMLEILKQTPFVRVPIKSILWGYDHPLIKLGNDVLPVERKLPFEQFGFFVGRNNSAYGGMLKALTGIRSVTDVGRITSINGETKLNFWKTEECNSIRGTDGSIFHPDVTMNETLYIFNKDLCQSLPLKFKEEIKSNGIDGYRFVPPADVFATPEENSYNDCYCMDPTGCSTPSGLFNMSICQFGSPLMLSWPHFFQADPKLVEAVEGLNPDPEKHQFYIDIQPKLGNGLGAAVRTQLNVAMKKVDDVRQVADLRDFIFPVFWFQDGVDEITDQNLVDLLHMALYTPEVARSVMYPSLFVIGAIVLICVGFFCYRRSQIQKVNPSKDMETATPKPAERTKTIAEVNGTKVNGVHKSNGHTN